MRYRGNFFENFSNANGSNDKVIAKDILLDEIAELIEEHRGLVIVALQDSGVNVTDKIGKKALIDTVVSNMYRNGKFRDNMIMLIISLNTGDINDKFSNADGKVKTFFQNLGMKFTNTFRKIGSKKSGGGDATDAAGTIVGRTASGASGGGAGAIIGIIGGVTESIFNFKASKEQVKAEEEASKRELYNKLLGSNKTNWTPIIVIGGVFLVGAVVLFTTLKNK